MSSSFSARFLGTGSSAGASALGNACLVLERNSQPQLMIDCGFTALDNYLASYHRLPAALFITHLHLDHVGGLEALFYRLRFGEHAPGLTRLFVPAELVPHLQRRLADYPGMVAEGGSNFWDVFQLCPVSEGFWLDGLHFRVFPARHHLPGSAWGLCLPGVFLFTSDTRPIPEQLVAHAAQGETVFHDCGLHGNPSHSGLDDILREYNDAQRQQMVLYHYASLREASIMEERGMKVAHPGDVWHLPAGIRQPAATKTDSGTTTNQVDVASQ